MKFALGKTGPFTCVTTTASGGIAVGSQDGTLRLYSGIPGLGRDERSSFPKSAKSNFPLFDEPVRGVDATSDGHWVVVTFSNKLILVDCDLGNGVTAFDKSMPVDDRPRHIFTLALTQEDTAKVGGVVSFSPARFNFGANEQYIVSSSGPYVVLWDLKGPLDHYQLRYSKSSAAAASSRVTSRKQQRARFAPEGATGEKPWAKVTFAGAGESDAGGDARPVLVGGGNSVGLIRRQTVPRRRSSFYGSVRNSVPGVSRYE